MTSHQPNTYPHQIGVPPDPGADPVDDPRPVQQAPAADPTPAPSPLSILPPAPAPAVPRPKRRARRK